MKIKMIVFGDENEPDYRKSERILVNAFSSLTNNDIDFPAVFPTPYTGLDKIGEALKYNDIIFVFADDYCYLDTKEAICDAFNFETITNDNLKKLHSRYANPEKYSKHSIMPKAATVFPLYDGLYSGFAMRSKSQSIFVLPFNQDRLFPTMKKFVFPFLHTVYNIPQVNFYTYVLADAADILQQQFCMGNIQVAIANTSVCKSIAHELKRVQSWQEHTQYAPYDKKHSDRNTSDLSAASALSYYDADLGVSIVDTTKPDDGDTYSCLITIATKSNATIRNITSLPDESKDDFFSVAISEMFIMLAGEIEKYKASQTIEEAQKKKKQKSNRAVTGPMIAFFIVLFVVVFGGTYLGAMARNDPSFITNLFSFLK